MPVPEVTPSRAGSGFIWPVRGKVLTKFGSQGGGLQNDGINIAAPRGAPIYAAENGVVVYAGNELSGFGNLLILRHADGWMTAYGHIDAMRVRRGDTVKRGQVIATVGQTGGVNAPQLHFEIRRGSTPVDPTRYLAGSGTAALRPSGAVRDDRPGPG
jgi:murein DD-endopeptidase MepM/ murein hydrolase activator NlpD